MALSGARPREPCAGAAPELRTADAAAVGDSPTSSSASATCGAVAASGDRSLSRACQPMHRTLALGPARSTNSGAAGAGSRGVPALALELGATSSTETLFAASSTVASTELQQLEHNIPGRGRDVADSEKTHLDLDGLNDKQLDSSHYYLRS